MFRQAETLPLDEIERSVGREETIAETAAQARGESDLYPVPRSKGWRVAGGVTFPEPAPFSAPTGGIASPRRDLAIRGAEAAIPEG